MLTKKNKNIMQQSPLKEKEIEQLGEKQQNAIVQLQYLFTYYSSKFSRHNYRELSHKSFMDMMKLLLDKNDTFATTRSSQQRKQQDQQIKLIQILFLSKRFKESMTFQQFLELIPSIGGIIYKQLKEEETFSMITKDLLNLYRREVEIKLSGKFINLDLNLQEKTFDYIMKLAPEFMKIYRMFFYHQLNGTVSRDEVRDQSQKCFFKFIQEFQVFPKLITAGGICLIYKQVIDSDQTEFLDSRLSRFYQSQNTKYSIGSCFTLGKFISMLVAVSKVTSQKIMAVEREQEQQKMCFRALLQYIQMAKVYKKQGHMKDSGKNFSFILLEEYPRQIVKENKVKAFNDKIKEKEKSSKKESEFLKMLKRMEI